MPNTDLETQVTRSLVTLLREVLLGAHSGFPYVLNTGDAGFLASVEELNAAQASAKPGGRSSIAAHVAHVCYGLSLLNKWSRGDNPFAEANYSLAWKQPHVSEHEWRALLAETRIEAQDWIAATEQPREWDHVTLTGTLSSVVHLAYHLGAIRQLDAQTSGPKAAD
ncbi:MAG: hypothetical protein ACT4P7_09000 [Gemmatimonadaceae bacterium]